MVITQSAEQGILVSCANGIQGKKVIPTLDEYFVVDEFSFRVTGWSA